MSAQTGRMVSADEARGDVSRQSWGPAWAEDLQHTVITQAEQIAAVLALHRSALEDDDQGRPWCAECGGMQPCPTARALGVSGE